MNRISKERARQLAVMAQLLDADRPSNVVDVVQHLGFLQMDPTSAVARSEHLQLWTRIGQNFDTQELARLLYNERSLYEHRAFIFPTSDYALHRPAMEEWPRGESAWVLRVRRWMEENEMFRKYILTELESRGPLRSRDLEDRSFSPWRSSGWTHGRNVGQMLEFLGARGEIAVTRRDGGDRVWDIASRVWPKRIRSLPFEKAEKIVAERRLKSLGIVRSQIKTKNGVSVEVEGLAGEWLANEEILGRSFTGRTAILSPFDRLIYDRERLLELFDFDYRLEIYVPPGKRRWGYFVMPVLNGDRLVARFDAKVDRKAGVFRVPAMHIENGATATDSEAAMAELGALATWLGPLTLALEGRP